MPLGRTPPENPAALREAEERFRAAFEEAGIGMVLMGLDGRFLRVNRELCDMLRRSADELLAGDGIRTISHPEDMDARRADFHRLVSGELPRYRRDRRYLRGDGTILWGTTTLALVRDDAGLPLYAVGQLADITARVDAEERLGRRAAQQSALARLSQLALREQDLPALGRATVRTITEILGVSFAGLARANGEGDLGFVAGAHRDDPGDSPAARVDDAHARRALAVRGPVIVGDATAEETFAAHGLTARGVASGVAVPVEGGRDEAPYGVLGMYSAAPRAFDDDDLAFLQAVANVLTGALRRVAAEEGLRHQALHDGLTQLPNRSLLLDRLRQGIARNRRSDRWLAVLYLDLDDFKSVNDSLGHMTGDELLRRVATRLSEALRPGDTLARLGGDEFAVLCDGLPDAAEGAAIAQRVLDVIGQPLTAGGVELRPSASIGVALGEPGAVASAEDLVRDADVAMYRAKAAGRGRFELFDDRMRADTLERVALTTDLRGAIERGELRLVYQPVVNFAERRVGAMEALVRWTHPERGEISPARFIPLAEQHGLIVDLGRWVLHEALDQLQSWRAAGEHAGALTMGVNVSRCQLSRPTLAGEVLGALSERGIAAGSFVVEVTESAVMDDPVAATATLEALHDGGVNIALDDFGVGQSSLACLRDLPLDGLKLDRAFITSLATSRDAAAIVRAVADMARTLRFPVVAEGIETEAQARVVEALGCERGQGFLYSRPVEAADLPRAVRRLDAELGGAPSVRAR